MNHALDDFESAFDDATPPMDPERAWRRVEKAMRRRLRGPTRELLGSLLVLSTCVVGGLCGVVTGWFVAGFLVLVILPERWKARKKWQTEIAAVGSADDIRALCAEQAKARAAGVLASFFLLSLLAIVYLAVALVAYLVGKSPWPGSIAALVLLAWGALNLLLRLPLASREWAILDAGE